jgi:hypothetical protein
MACTLCTGQQKEKTYRGGTLARYQQSRRCIGTCWAQHMSHRDDMPAAGCILRYCEVLLRRLQQEQPFMEKSVRSLELGEHRNSTCVFH